MAVSKVIVNGVTKIDLTQDTVTADKLYGGRTAHDCAGEMISGTSYGSSPTDGTEKTLNFIDFTGEIRYSYTLEEALSLAELPANPNRSYQRMSSGPLTSQGWNWTLQQIQEHLVKYPDSVVNVGQMYVTDDGATRLYCYFNDTTPQVYVGIGVLGTVDVDWGDGSSHGTFTGNSVTTTQFLYHAYSSSGRYIISLLPASGSSLAFNGSTSYGSFILRHTNSTSEILTVNTSYLDSIERIELGNNVTLRSSCFYGCRNLKGITVPSSITFASQDSCFNLCHSLKALALPPSQTTIGSSEFSGCSSLKYIMLPPTVTLISTYAFSSCGNLKNVTLSDGLETIDYNAFSGCHSLISIILPSTLSTIPTQAFYQCRSLKKVKISNGPTTISVAAFKECGALTSINIPPSITSIQNSVFEYCNSLTSVELPDTLTYLGNGVFTNMENLEYICLPDSLTSIGTNLFSGDPSLKEVGIEAGITNLPSYMFGTCQGLQSVTIPQTVTSIASYAFSECRGLKEIHLLGTTIPTLASNVFYNVPAGFKIYVPYTEDHSVLNAYKVASGWSTYSTYMFEEPDGWRKLVGIAANGGTVAVGTEFTVSNRFYGDVDFIVRRTNVEHVTGDSTIPTVTIQQKHLIHYIRRPEEGGAYAIDAREAFHEPLTSIIPAGTVCKFTTNAKSSVLPYGYSVGTFHFTAASTIPVGAVLCIRDECGNDIAVDLADNAVTVYLNQKAKEPLAEYPIVEGDVSDAFNLGTWGTDCNHTDRVNFGSNNIAESNLNWYLNVCTWDYEIDDVWEPATKYDMLDETCGDISGYLTGFPAAFRAALRRCDIHVLTGSFESQDSIYTARSQYTYSCKVWLPSMREIFGSNYYGSNELVETQFPAFVGTTNADKAMHTRAGTTTYPYFMRTPLTSTACYNGMEYTGQGAYTINAASTVCIAPAAVLG